LEKTFSVPATKGSTQHPAWNKQIADHLYAIYSSHHQMLSDACDRKPFHGSDVGSI